MTTPHPRRRHAPRRRAGFTIVELLMVILIIGVLAALLFPAIQKAIESTRIAEVVTEMRAFDSGIQQFKSRFGIEPPSFIVLYEQGAVVGSGQDWGAHGAAGSQTDLWRTTSRSLVRQMWPEFDFNSLGDSAALPLAVGPGNPTAGNDAIDINGDGDEDDVLILNGAECLAFFLIGVPRQTDFNGDGTIDGWSADGFASNPRAPLAAGGNRIPSFFNDYDPVRLIDIDSQRGIDTLELMPEYLDSLPGQQLPYQYLSSYNGRGYQQWGLDQMVGTADDELLPPGVGLANYYMQVVPSTAYPNGQGWNKNSFQLISPGFDYEYGTGGFYGGDNVPVVPPAGTPARAVERDNITNFKGGKLN